MGSSRISWSHVGQHQKINRSFPRIDKRNMKVQKVLDEREMILQPLGKSVLHSSDRSFFVSEIMNAGVDCIRGILRKAALSYKRKRR